VLHLAQSRPTPLFHNLTQSPEIHLSENGFVLPFSRRKFSRTPATNPLTPMNHAERERLFLEMFHQNKSRVQRLCFAYLNSTADIDDLFQEIMTNLWNALPTFRGDSHPNTWPYRIAINTALLYRRKRRPSEPLPEITDPGPSTHQHLEDAERLAALRRAIASLPDQDRLIITLLLESLSYREIAEVTGLTVNHVGVKISRIKQAIEHRMNQQIAGEVNNGAI